jgi:hypothetical protein
MSVMGNAPQSARADDQARRMHRVRKHYQHYDRGREKRAAWDKLGQELDMMEPAVGPHAREDL